MGRVFEAASETVHRTGVEEGLGMGTTLTVAAIAGDAMVVGHVGDCRLYRVRRGRLQVITHDHSLRFSIEHHLDSLRAGGGTNRIHRRLDHRCKIDLLRLQAQLSRNDTRSIHQIFD